MEQPRHVSSRAGSTRLALGAVLVVALFSAGTVRSAGAQTNTSLGTGALASITTGTGDTALGFDALNANTTGNSNTATGAAALQGNITGEANTATGLSALATNNGNNNTATGFDALLNNITGGENTAIGIDALINNNEGSNNIAVGAGAGSAIGGSNNIDIGNRGAAADVDAIRIGTPGVQTRTVIAGIRNAPVFFGLPVLVGALGRLGTQVSSARFKRDIRDMGEASDRLMKLRPVTFRYKVDPKGRLQYGLVAEEVARVYPELVTYGDDGKAQSVAYHLLPAMLLNEMQKQVRENQRKDVRIAALEGQLVAQQRKTAALQKETARIATLTARLGALEEQARRAGPERLAAASH